MPDKNHATTYELLTHFHQRYLALLFPWTNCFAVFTAICRKNYECSHFIVGRDHTGVGNYYASKASQDIFENIDIDIKILRFDSPYYSDKKGANYVFQENV